MPVPVVVEAGIERLDDIHPLWESLNRLHESVTPHFKAIFAKNSFAYRKLYLEGKHAAGNIRIFFAEDNGNPVGYLVVSLSDQHGEIESLFIKEAYRGNKLGDSLMRAALNWLDSNGATSKSINVVFGNEAAHPFYAKYGFFPRSTTLYQR